MKTKLLLVFLFAVHIAIAQNLVISEIMVNPSGSDSPHEYIEFRGDPGATIAAGTYFLSIEGDGDGTNNPGDVEAAGGGGIIDLSGRVLGSNGYLVLLTTGNDYTVDPNGTVLLDETDGDLEGQSHTFLLVNTSTPPTSSDDIDVNDDGIPDGVYLTWTILDGVSFIDDDNTDTIEFAYADVIFAEAAMIPNLLHPPSATVISTSTQYDYAGRIGNSTGSVVSNDPSVEAVDWIGADVPSSTSSPRLWLLGSSSSSVRAHPESWEGSELNHIGGTNPSMNTTLSITTVDFSDLQVYPNPAKDFIQISSDNTQITSVQILNPLGKTVLSTTNVARIKVSSLAKGMYFLKINTNTKSTTKKIIIN